MIIKYRKRAWVTNIIMDEKDFLLYLFWKLKKNVFEK